MSNRHFWRFSFCVFSALSSVWDVLENQKFLHISHLSVLCIHTFLPFFFEQGINDTSGWVGGNGEEKTFIYPIPFNGAVLSAMLSDTSGRHQNTDELLEGASIGEIKKDRLNIVCDWTKGDISKIRILIIGI